MGEVVVAYTLFPMIRASVVDQEVAAAPMAL
jgi:hypothetical protein